MAREKDNYRGLLAFFLVSLLSPFIYLSSDLSPWKESFTPVSLLQELVYPIERSWSSATGFITDTWTYYRQLRHAANENQRLHAELEILQAKLMTFDEQKHEISRLSQLLELSQKPESEMIVAEVLGSPKMAPFQTIRVSKGTTSDIKVGMPVIAPNGIVGRVLRTGLNYSDVQVATDSDFNLDVILQRTRVRGVISGLSNSRCILKLNRRAEIRIGDHVITSGIVGSFPKGLPVGHVVRISYELDNVTQKITVEPWVDHTRLEEVMILKIDDPEIQKIIESAGEQWISSSLNKASGG